MIIKILFIKLITEIYFEYKYKTNVITLDILCDLLSIYFVYYKLKIQNSVIEMMKISIFFIMTQFSMFILDLELFFITLLMLVLNIPLHIFIAKLQNKKETFLPCAISEIEYDNNCSICLDTLLHNLQNPITKLSCKHIYHIKCLELSLKYSNKCPSCRENIT